MADFKIRIILEMNFMKIKILNLFLQFGMSVSLSAQTYNILHNFGGIGKDGYAPLTDLVFGSNTLYGTTASGGTNGNGTIFKINTDGNGYGILRSLTNSPSPAGGMVLIGNTLYGTMYTGGSANNGSIFKINIDGTGYTELHSFSATVPTIWGTNSDGNRPQGDLVADGDMLYGTAQYGGTNGSGTIFKINTDGSQFTVIKTLSATYLGTNNVGGNPLVSGTNTDGARPLGSLILYGSTLYGTTYHGGISSNGVVFAIQTDGSEYKVLKYFSGISAAIGAGTNSDGAAPIAGLTLRGDTLYGVAVGGGAGAGGDIFKLKTNGTCFVNLHNFLPNDGFFPRNTLLLDGGTLYGTTGAGGLSNNGTIFMVRTNGADFKILKNFNMSIGAQCDSKFVLNSNMLFGTAVNGGTNGGGVVFGLTVLPQIIMSDDSFGIQSNAFGFNLVGISNQTAIVEASTNLSEPDWQPLQTNMLDGAPIYFYDPTWNQYASRFYRVRSP
jgi:uncharacterized repeat protein (TIGR03803 family)